MDWKKTNVYDSINIAKTVWNAILQFLRHGIEWKWLSFYDVN